MSRRSASATARCLKKRAATDSFAARFLRPRAVALALRVKTTAFSRGYILSPLRGFGKLCQRNKKVQLVAQSPAAHKRHLRGHHHHELDIGFQWKIRHI